MVDPVTMMMLAKSAGKVAGSGISTALGAGQLIAGKIQQKKADALVPPSESVMERQMLQSIRRRRRALETGTAGSADRAAIRQMGKSFGRNMFQAGGRGNLGQIAALQSQAMQNLAATYGQQTNALMSQEQQQANRMAGVSRDLSLLRSDRMSARAEANIQGGTQNLLAGMGGGGGSKGGGKQGGGSGGGITSSIMELIGAMGGAEGETD